jgi:PAS domain S-box-containing protein
MRARQDTLTPAATGLSQQAQAMLDTMQLGVTQAKPDGEILYANPAVAEMHGYEVDELVGKDLSLFEASPASGSTIAGSTITGGWSAGSTSWASERVHKRKDGSTLIVRAMSDVVSGSTGGTIVTGYEDITERRHAEGELRARHERESLQATLLDPLTGLPNKVLLLDLVETALGRLPTPQGLPVRDSGFEPRPFSLGQRWSRVRRGGSVADGGVGATEAMFPIG